MTTGFPVSPLTPATFLVVGLTGIELGEHQRFAASLPLRGLDRHDDRMRRARSVSRCEDDRAHRIGAAPASRAIGSSRRWSSPRTASSTTSCSSAWPSGRSRSRSRRSDADPDARLRSAARRSASRRCCRRAARMAYASSPTWARRIRSRPRGRCADVARAPGSARPVDRDRHGRRRARRGARTGTSRSRRPASRSRRWATGSCPPTPTSAPNR